MYFHGFPGSRLEGRLAAGAAERLGQRLLAPDRPGFGASTFQHHRTLLSWAADVAQLADRLALGRFAVIGVSGGGPYALACAARIPERVSCVALVGALAPIAGIASTAGMVARNRLALAMGAHAAPLARLGIALAARVIRRNPARYLAYLRADAPPADRAVLADPGYRALFAASLAESLRQDARGAAHELTLLARPWGFRLAGIRTPVRVWHGLADNIVPPSMARHLAAGLAASALHCLPGEGHLSLLAHSLDAALVDLHASAEASRHRLT